MAPKDGGNNFTNLTNLKQQAAGLNEGGAFGGSDPRILASAEAAERAALSGKSKAARTELEQFEQLVEAEKRAIDRKGRDSRYSRNEDLRTLKEKEKGFERQIAQQRQLERATKNRKDIEASARDDEIKKTLVTKNILEGRLKITRLEISSRAKASADEERSLRRQADQYEDILETRRKAYKELDNHEGRQRNRFAYHLGTQRTLHRALQYYGNNKIGQSLPRAMGGSGEGFSAKGVGVGLLGLGAGMAIEAALDQLIKAFTRNYQFKVGASDLLKGTGGGAGTEDFMSGLRKELVRYGVTREEIVTIGQQIRPQVGQFAGGEAGFRRLMEQGISMDRTFGSQLGTGGATLADLVRKSSLGSNKQDFAQFSMAFSEALGRSGMIGLQEEMSKGLLELVELSRRSNIYGADPNMFLRMITDLSSASSAKNLKGLDAANAIASLSQGVSNPQSAIGQLISMMALRQTVAGSKNASTRALASNGPALLNLQPQGFGLTIGGESLGEDYLRNTINTVRSIAGMNRKGLTEQQQQFSMGIAQQILYNKFGITPQAGEVMLTNPELVSHKQGGVLQSFGLNNISNEDVTKPGAMAYIQFLAQAKQMHGTSQEAVDEANKKIKELLGGESGKVDEAIKLNQGKSLADQTSAVLKAASSGPLTEADKNRAMVELFKNKFEEWADKILRILTALARSFGVDMNDKPEKPTWQKISETIADKTQDALGLNREALYPQPKATLPVQKLDDEYANNDVKTDNVLDVWANAIQAHEGWKKGSMSFRNNNPGNLTGEGDAGFEWDKEHAHKFAKYSTVEAGMGALKRDLKGKALKYPDYTVLQIMNRYLGGTDPNLIRKTEEGDPFAYADAVAKAMHVDINTKLRDLKFDEAPKQTAKEVANNYTNALDGNISINYTHTVQDQNGGVVSKNSKTTPVKVADLNKKLSPKQSFTGTH